MRTGSARPKLAQRVYWSVIKEKPIEFDFDYYGWKMAEKFGWTFDYIDSLPLSKFQEFAEFETILDGVRKGSDYLRRKKQIHAPKGVKRR